MKSWTTILREHSIQLGNELLTSDNMRCRKRPIGLALNSKLHRRALLLRTSFVDQAKSNCTTSTICQNCKSKTSTVVAKDRGCRADFGKGTPFSLVWNRIYFVLDKRDDEVRHSASAKES
jgi:hypothetical protein